MTKSLWHQETIKLTHDSWQAFWCVHVRIWLDRLLGVHNSLPVKSPLWVFGGSCRTIARQALSRHLLCLRVVSILVFLNISYFLQTKRKSCNLNKLVCLWRTETDTDTLVLQSKTCTTLDPDTDPKKMPVFAMLNSFAPCKTFSHPYHVHGWPTQSIRLQDQCFGASPLDIQV